MEALGTEFEIIANYLNKHGFVRPCACDMASYLISALARPTTGSIEQTVNDIDKVIEALKLVKEHLIN